ncbi:hypothetical protein GW17_00023846 [Ensete ventricosum]|nr:hypothetical protein GW17_00023846 [Ensete ventricosum]
MLGSLKEDHKTRCKNAIGHRIGGMGTHREIIESSPKVIGSLSGVPGSSPKDDRSLGVHRRMPESLLGVWKID